MRLASLEETDIAHAAASLVADGDVVVLAVGRRLSGLGSALRERTELVDVTVVTNSLAVALELEAAAPRITVVVTGGTLCPGDHALVDPLASSTLASLNPDVAFVECAGFHPLRGVTATSFNDGEVKRQMLSNARRRVVLADGPALGRVEPINLCAVAKVDILVTNATAPPAVVADIEAMGVSVLVAD